ncbi:phosphotransferase enzyme family protein [Legionella worsleiensis]|uniref:Serine/threonine protein kinase n=1 Tax=Legionella worsleiensis TaxID=45076 RepID=A0A0W1A3D1_9GAMM|nr:phosphotransferase [Legionella worsleiensis]KTD75873.1 serine/threonine protein kinase [Legionella worsleiensis]STY32886.1 serine/threonine protein kinase [Legionella worsleiensis]
MILKNPSWQTLSPGLPAFIPVDAVKAMDLQSKANIRGSVYQASFDGQPSSFYLIKAEQNQTPYFIKCFTAEHADHYQKAEQVALWLQNQNIKANATLNWQSAGCLIYPFLDGRRLASSSATLKNLGRALAKMHEALRRYPNQIEIQNQTDYRINLLNEIRSEIAKGRLKIGPFPDYVRALAQDECLNFTQGTHTQVLHGDLHPGNMMQVDDTIYFFDFEDTLHSHLPLVYELALVMERLIFVRHDSAEDIVHLGRDFLNSYRSHGGLYQFHETDVYAQSTLALRSLCVLTLCELEGNKIDAQEWNKFRNLSELAANTHPILKAILQV